MMAAVLAVSVSAFAQTPTREQLLRRSRTETRVGIALMVIGNAFLVAAHALGIYDATHFQDVTPLGAAAPWVLLLATQAAIIPAIVVLSNADSDRDRANAMLTVRF
jgi:hypothetical protein